MDYCNSKPAKVDLLSSLARLVERGDIVEVIRGRLTITPKSGRPIPDLWLKENENLLVLDMANLTNKLYLSYTGFDCGFYGQHKAGGLNLHLTNMKDNKECYTIFNIGLKRQRDSKTGQAGARLPKGQFTVTKKQNFYAFWLSSALKIPDRPSSRLWAYMGNLKPLHLTASYDPSDTKREKIQTKTLEPLSVSYESITQLIHKPCSSQAQGVHSKYTKAIHTETRSDQQPQGIQAISTTGKNNHGTRLQGKEVISNHDTHPNSLINQSVDDWLAENIEEGNNPTFHLGKI
jgi:hypothetical protein